MSPGKADVFFTEQFAQWVIKLCWSHLLSFRMYPFCFFKTMFYWPEKTDVQHFEEKWTILCLQTCSIWIYWSHKCWPFYMDRSMDVSVHQWFMGFFFAHQQIESDSQLCWTSTLPILEVIQTSAETCCRKHL